MAVRRRWSFGLRTMMVVVAVAGLLIGLSRILMEQMLRQGMRGDFSRSPVDEDRPMR